MKRLTAPRPPSWYWIAAGLALLWNLLGVTAYVAEAYGAGQSEAHRILVDARPAWATAAYAIAVFGGALGCVALLMRRRWALPLLVTSFAALLVQQAWNFTGSTAALAREGPAAGFAAAVVLVSIGLMLLAWTAGRRGWLR